MRARTWERNGREVSGQYRVTVPDPDALDRLQMQNRVYDHTLTPRDRFAGSVPIGVRSLPGSSRESSMEPMDTDEGAKTTRKIMESIRVARSWVHSDSVGYLLDTNPPLLTARSRREGPGLMATGGEMSGVTTRETECHRIANPVTNSTVCDSWSCGRGGSKPSPASIGGSCT